MNYSLDGEWKVKVTYGHWWFKAFNILRDKKVIKGNQGYNVIMGKKWGRFKVIKNHYITILKYTDMRIVDSITFKSKNKMQGNFYFKGRKIGEFEMERIILT